MSFDWWLDFIVNKFLFWLLAALIGLEVYNLVFHRSVPNIRTAPAIRRKLIELIKEDRAAHAGQPYTILDLGSGNGQVTRAMARAMPDAKVIGIEIAPQTVLWANIRKYLAKLGNLSYVRASFLDYDFSKADMIFMYMVPHYLWPLSKKLRAEAKTGTLIICNKFPLPDGWVPEQTIAVKTRYFHQRDLHIYRKA